MQQPVGVDGVGPLGLAEPEEQALLGGHGLGALDHLLAGRGAAAVLGAQVLGHGLLGHPRRGRVELEGAVDDLHVVGVREARQGGLEAALADVAPGTDDVGPDLDLHDGHNRGNDPNVPACDATVAPWHPRSRPGEGHAPALPGHRRPAGAASSLVAALHRATQGCVYDDLTASRGDTSSFLLWTLAVAAPARAVLLVGARKAARLRGDVRFLLGATLRVFRGCIRG